jgi:hypothetical protein
MTQATRFEWQGVLAAHYSSTAGAVVHLVALVPFEGRRGKRTLVRSRGATLCKRIPSDHMAGPFSAYPASETCPRCVQLRNRWLDPGDVKAD